MKLTLIRHTSVDVPRGICYGRTDVPLAPTFADEAGAVAEALSHRKFDHVFTSPLSRCVRLAEACGYPDATRDQRLLEMHFGDWEMQAFDKINDPRLQEWFDDYMHVEPTNGESAMQQRERFLDFIAGLKQSVSPDASVAAFTHAGILVHALVAFGVTTYTEAYAAIPPYGSIIELDI